jgi:hypothetical protein
MAPEKLEILISADNKKAIAAIKETILSLDGVEKASKGAGGATQKLGKDFTGVSRVIQDLPYGFNAIANNLTNILPAAGALGLGISALVAGLQFAQLGFGNWTRGLMDSKEAMEGAKKVNDDYISTLAKEKTELDLLFKTMSNTNLSMNVRNNAIEKARGLYGTYLSNLTDEQLLAGNVGDAYTRLSVAIEKAAKARAAQDFIVEKQKQVLTLEQEIAKEREKLEKRKIEIQKEGTTVTQTTMGAVGQILTVQQKLDLAEAGFIARTKDKTAAIKVLNTEMNSLSQTYEDNADNVNTNTTKKTKAVEVSKEEINAYIKAQKALEQYNAQLDNSNQLEALKNKLKASQNIIFGAGGLISTPNTLPQQKDLTNIQLTTTANNALNKALSEQTMTLELLKQKKDEAFAADTANYLTQQMSTMFNAMINGQSIGTALGDMFKRLAVDIALAAAKAAIFQGIMAALTMGGSTAFKGGQAVGASLMGGTVTGGAKKGGFLSLLGKLLGFAEGGTVSGPRSGYPVMLHGTEHIVRPDQMRSIIASAAQMGGGSNRVIVEGRISGNDIFISQKRTSTFRALTT